VRAGFFYALNAKTDYKSACYLMLLGVHSTTIWMGSQDVLLGAALGFAYRLSVTAAIGEWRYLPRIKASMLGKYKPSEISREAVYDKVWDKSHTLRGTYMRALRDFRTQTWNGAVGGEPWFRFTKWAAVIMNSVLSGDLVAALAAMNNAVHSSHNNGWGFNKFAADGAMNTVAGNPVKAFNYCAPLVYNVVKDATQWKYKQDAQKWFVKARPLPIHTADNWVRKSLSDINGKNAELAQAVIVGDSIRVQYKANYHTGLFSEETIKLSQAVLDILAKSKLLNDGRMLPSFASEDTEKYIGLRCISGGGVIRWALDIEGTSVDITQPMVEVKVTEEPATPDGCQCPLCKPGAGISAPSPWGTPQWGTTTGKWNPILSTMEPA
jgi:hypothetical protein